MLINNRFLRSAITAFFCISASLTYADKDFDPRGQIIQIHTRLYSFVGQPIWTLIIRDIDNNKVYPYLFDFSTGENDWQAFTYSKNYLITVSRMQIVSYESCFNKYKNYRLNNFCHLESNGRVHRGESMIIDIEGDLSPNTDTFNCHISTYREDPYLF